MSEPNRDAELRGIRTHLWANTALLVCLVLGLFVDRESALALAFLGAVIGVIVGVCRGALALSRVLFERKDLAE